MTYVKSKVARDYLWVSNDILRNWTKDAKIEFFRIITGPPII